MEDILLEIFAELRTGRSVDAKALESMIRRHNRNKTDNSDHLAKKGLLPYYLRTKETDPDRWKAWQIDESLERAVIKTLQVKPRRTASGVATITVLTKPWKCSSDCLYCPNDLRMPKSYLSDEPACQRAERNCFDPYLQVTARLRALVQMGHVTDKVELIVLGGTWSDYPQAYQVWFVKELFRALNEAETTAEEHERRRRAFYEAQGLSFRKDDLRAFVSDEQRALARGEVSYNHAMERLYEHGPVWRAVSQAQHATFDELDEQHRINERAAHRAVGLVVETRPDAITCANLALIRRLGCTKVQIGVQSLDPRILRLNRRGIGIDRIQRAFELLRLFGFKIHAHFMANLYGATPDGDKADYRRLVEQPEFLPDEVKLYPCVLVDDTGLCSRYEDGSWRPYTEEELLDVLTADMAATPPYVRVSRMIRDISAHDIVAGNKKVNLRQLVDQKAHADGTVFREIRSREISTDHVDLNELRLQDIAYATSVSTEHFLQWILEDGRIAGFLRLSLPNPGSVEALGGEAPVALGEAMIREVHVYGAVASLHQTSAGAQHLGLGKRLVERACQIALDAGYSRVNVISSVGTRDYYRHLGFADHGLYQQKPLG